MKFSIFFFLIFLVLISCTFVSASTCPVGVYPCNSSVNFNNPVKTNTVIINDSTFNVNNSNCWQGFCNSPSSYFWATDTSQSGLTGTKAGSYMFADSGNKLSISPDSRILYTNNAGIPKSSVDWKQHILYGLDGLTARVSWNIMTLNGNWTEDGTALCLADGTNCASSGNSSWNQSLADTLYTNKTIGNNLINQNCPDGLIVNGTLNNGTFICTNVSTGGISYWTESGGYLYPTTYTDAVAVGTNAMSGDGEQMYVYGNGMHNVLTVDSSTDAPFVTIGSITNGGVYFQYDKSNSLFNIGLHNAGNKIIGYQSNGVAFVDTIVDTAQISSIDTNNRATYDSSGTPSISYSNRQLYHSSNGVAEDWSNPHDVSFPTRINIGGGNLASKLWVKGSPFYTQCTGTLNNCSDMNADSTTCNSVSGCSYGECEGNLDCSSLDEGQCNFYQGNFGNCQSNYSTFSSCSDGTLNCGDINNQYGCELMPSNECIWADGYCQYNSGMLSGDCNEFDEADCQATSSACSINYLFTQCDTTGACIQINNIDDCNQIPAMGCSWNNTCFGSILDTNCNQIPFDSCTSINTNNLCSYGNSCNGDFQDCTQLITEGQCNLVSGCGWNTIDTCSGNPHECSYWDGEEYYCGNSGCDWNVGDSTCSGTPHTCDIYTEGSGCQYYGCTWTPANSCNGTAVSTSCSQFNESDCSIQDTSNLCSWSAGTDEVTHTDQTGVGQTADAYNCKDSAGTIGTSIDASCGILTTEAINFKGGQSKILSSNIAGNKNYLDLDTGGVFNDTAQSSLYLGEGGIYPAILNFVSYNGGVVIQGDANGLPIEFSSSGMSGGAINFKTYTVDPIQFITNNAPFVQFTGNQRVIIDPSGAFIDDGVSVLQVNGNANFTGDITVLGIINTDSNFSVQGNQGLTYSEKIEYDSTLSINFLGASFAFNPYYCYNNFTGGILTWTNCPSS